MGWILRTKKTINYHRKIKHLYAEVDTLSSLKLTAINHPKKWWFSKFGISFFEGAPFSGVFAVSFREGIQSSHGYIGIQIEHDFKKQKHPAVVPFLLGPGEWVHVIRTQGLKSWPPTNWDIKKGDGFNHLMTWTKNPPFLVVQLKERDSIRCAKTPENI